MKNRIKKQVWRALKHFFVFSLAVVILAHFIAYAVFPAMERESQWQAQRLCKSHDACSGTGV